MRRQIFEKNLESLVALHFGPEDLKCVTCNEAREEAVSTVIVLEESPYLQMWVRGTLFPF